MERSLRNRLTYGPIMLAALGLLLWLDNRIEASTRPLMKRHEIMQHGIGGVGILILLICILPLAVRELATLFTAERVRPYRVIAAAGAGSLVLHAFLTQFPFFKNIAASTRAFVIVFVMLLPALRRAMGKHTQDAIVRMAGT